ncbi:MAG: hypothetical protein WC459_01120 [Patescibacteria group bacterium]
MTNNFEMPSAEDNNEKEELITLHEYKREKAPLEESEEDDLIELGEYHGMPKAETNKKRGLRAMFPEKRKQEAAKEEDKPVDIKEEEKVKEPEISKNENRAEEELEKDLGDLLKEKKEPEEVVELTDKKNIFNPEKMSLDELDDRVHALWKSLEEVVKDAAAWKPTKQEKTKLQEFIKKGGDWPLDDAVTAKNFKERLEKYGIVDYIDPSLIEKGRDPYAVISKQYGLYRDELEKRIRKAKLRQLEEADGGVRTKKKEEYEVVDTEIEKELPPENPEEILEPEKKSEEQPELDKNLAEAIRKDIESEKAERKEEPDYYEEFKTPEKTKEDFSWKLKEIKKKEGWKPATKEEIEMYEKDTARGQEEAEGIKSRVLKDLRRELEMEKKVGKMAAALNEDLKIKDYAENTEENEERTELDQGEEIGKDIESEGAVPETNPDFYEEFKSPEFQDEEFAWGTKKIKRKTGKAVSNEEAEKYEAEVARGQEETEKIRKGVLKGLKRELEMEKKVGKMAIDLNADLKMKDRDKAEKQIEGEIRQTVSKLKELESGKKRKRIKKEIEVSDEDIIESIDLDWEERKEEAEKILGRDGLRIFEEEINSIEKEDGKEKAAKIRDEAFQRLQEKLARKKIAEELVASAAHSINESLKAKKEGKKIARKEKDSERSRKTAIIKVKKPGFFSKLFKRKK